jgi:hypothetical protein
MRFRALEPWLDLFEGQRPLLDRLERLCKSASRSH